MKKLLFLGMLFFSTPCFAISFDAVSSATAATASTLSWIHVISGGDCGLVLNTMEFDPTTVGNVSSITYAGTPLTLVRRQGQAQLRHETWFLKNPASSSNTITVTFGGTRTDLAAIATSYNGLSRFIQPDNSASNAFFASSASVTLLTKDISTVIVSGVSDYQNTNIVPNTNFTERAEVTTSSNSKEFEVSDRIVNVQGSYTPGASSMGSNNATVIGTSYAAQKKHHTLLGTG